MHSEVWKPIDIVGHRSGVETIEVRFWGTGSRWAERTDRAAIVVPQKLLPVENHIAKEQ